MREASMQSGIKTTNKIIINVVNVDLILCLSHNSPLRDTMMRDHTAPRRK